jgi:hypothetical protein
MFGFYLKHTVLITNNNRLILFWEEISVYFDNHVKPTKLKGLKNKVKTYALRKILARFFHFRIEHHNILIKSFAETRSIIL